jgi:hypothetical protein
MPAVAMICARPPKFWTPNLCRVKEFESGSGINGK